MQIYSDLRTIIIIATIDLRQIDGKFIAVPLIYDYSRVLMYSKSTASRKSGVWLSATLYCDAYGRRAREWRYVLQRSLFHRNCIFKTTSTVMELLNLHE